MNELSQFMNRKANYRCSVIQYPSGRFGFVGSIPEQLCIKKRNTIGQDYMASKVYNTKEEAEKELEAVKL